MGHHESSPVTVDPQEVSRASDMWIRFTGMMKYGVIVVAVILAGMALFLV